MQISLNSSVNFPLISSKSSSYNHQKEVVLFDHHFGLKEQPLFGINQSAAMESHPSSMFACISSILPLLGINSSFRSYKSVNVPHVLSGLSLISHPIHFVVPPFRFSKKRKTSMKRHPPVNRQYDHFHFTVIHREVIHKPRILLHTIQHYLTNNLCIK